MAKPISFGKLEFELVASMDEARMEPSLDTPFSILVMGDFSGRADRGLLEKGAPLAGRRLRRIDRDNLDEVMAALGVEIRLPLSGGEGPSIPLRFLELDDFHPDRIFEHLALFREIRERRRKMGDPVAFAEACAQLQKKGGDAPSRPDSKGTEESLGKLATETTSELLDQILDDTQGSGEPGTAKRATSEWDLFLKRIVEPHLVPDVEEAQDRFLKDLDTASGEMMRAILHYPVFQEIEAAWRGLHFLVSRMEGDEQLKLYILDISRDELAADLGSADDLRTTAIYRLLVEQMVETPGAEPWSLLVGAYTFEGSLGDAELLGRMAKVARAAGAPFIAAAGDGMLGCGSLAATPDPKGWRQTGDVEEKHAWDSLRSLSESAFLGLALPRFLLRLPYGSETDPVDSFAFEEMDAPPEHGHYLWGNPALVCALLLGQSFSEMGWEMTPGIIQDVEGLPLHVYREKGESRIKPCAETLLTQGAAEIIMEKGLMPLISFKNRDTVRLGRFQSVSALPSQLAGRWGKAG
jgi:type VI secretion system protein ImpC